MSLAQAFIGGLIFTVLALGCWVGWLIRTAPLGYEDETGFHEGSPEILNNTGRQVSDTLGATRSISPFHEPGVAE